MSLILREVLQTTFMICLYLSLACNKPKKHGINNILAPPGISFKIATLYQLRAVHHGWHINWLHYCMEQSKFYTIEFMYEIAEDAIRFPLLADVTIIADNVYFIGNIRHLRNGKASLVPSLTLIKYKQRWIYKDSKKETALSITVGRAIDAYEQNCR